MATERDLQIVALCRSLLSGRGRKCDQKNKNLIMWKYVRNRLAFSITRKQEKMRMATSWVGRVRISDSKK